MRIGSDDELEKFAGQNRILALYERFAQYFSTTENSESEDVGSIGAATEPNNPTTYKNAENTRQAVETKEQQNQMPNRDEGVRKALMAQELLAMYNKVRLDLT